MLRSHVRSTTAGWIPACADIPSLPGHNGLSWRLWGALPRALWQNSVDISYTRHTRRPEHGPTHHTAAAPTASPAGDPGDGPLGLLRWRPHAGTHYQLGRHRGAGDADAPGGGRTRPADGRRGAARL